MYGAKESVLLFENFTIFLGLGIGLTMRAGCAVDSIEVPAFGRGDVETIIAYHHPNVIKTLGYHKILTGRDAVQADMFSTFQVFTISFEENIVESVLFQGKTVVQQNLFTIKGVPKKVGEPFLAGSPTTIKILI